MAVERLRYLAYLLRLWQVRIDGEVVWRGSIEDPHTGERRGFANLDRLFGFLAEQTRSPIVPEGEAGQREIQSTDK